MNKLYKCSDRYEFINKLQNKSSYYLICIDIINFKKINNKFCFYDGDILLYEIIEYINQLSKDNLFFCRYESDRIMIMIESTEEKEVFSVVNKIISKKYMCSIGLRVGYLKIEDYKNLADFLDGIAYVIKKEKYIAKDTIDRNFDLSLDISKYVAIKEDILENKSDNFNLVYQPKISTTDKKVASCEVLSRWNNPKIGSSTPNEFLSIIKNLYKEAEFDLMIFEKACLEIRNLKNIITKFSINISIKSIIQYGFVEKLNEIAQKYNMKTENITLEIIEDMCNENYKVVSTNIDKLVELGFRISIDDFGTGYSSYYRLAELNFSEVKIAKEFFYLEDNKYMQKNIKILLGIVNMCKGLNCEIVIEGVENEGDVNLAESLKVDYIQGYYYSKPLNIEQYIGYIKSLDL